MVGITAVTVIVGIVLVQTASTKAEEDLHAKFLHLESQVTSLNRRLQQEEEKVFRLQRQDELLKQRLENCTALQSEKFEDAIDRFQGQSKHKLFGISGRHSRSVDPDAFTASLGTELANVPLHTTIKFDNIIHHTDDYYNSNTGVFTCPTSGLYLFSVFIMQQYNGIESMVALTVDGTSYMYVIVETSYSGEDDIGGNVVLLNVNKGQRVWVETYENDGQSFWKGFTTFSGVLIHHN